MKRTDPKAALQLGLTAGVLGLSLAAGLGTASSMATPTPTATATIEPGTCRADVAKLAPERAYLHQAMPITLTFEALCVGITYELHAVLVMDGSVSMEGKKSRDMKEAATEFVKDLKLDDNPETRLGVVDFNTRGRTLTWLTNDEVRVIGGIRRVQAQGDKVIAAGIGEGLKVLMRGRSGRKYGDHEVMLVFTDGLIDGNCRDELAAANQAKSQGVLMITICVGSECDDRCLRQMASSPRYYFQLEQMGQIRLVFQSIRDELTNIVAKRVTVTEKLPANMRLVPDSVDPEPTAISPDGRELTWQTNFVPKDGVTYALQVEPQELGSHPTNEEAIADFLNNLNWHATAVFPVPTVLVIAPPTVTPTSTPTATATATATQSPTPTATAGTTGLYLPRLVKGQDTGRP